MITEIEKRFKERQITKVETRLTIILCLMMVAFTAVLGLVAYYVPGEPIIEDRQQLNDIFFIINLVVVMVMICILGVRRSVYYSPRFIDEDYTLTQVLRKWRKIDLIFLAMATAIPITGLVTSFLGLPFDRTFHFFLASAILMLIIMPLGLKVKSKLTLLRKTFPDIEIV